MRLLVCLLVPLSLFAVETTERLSASGDLKVGARAPAFGSFNVLAGGATVGLGRTMAQPGVKGVILTIFGTYCLPCRKGLETLEAAKATLEAQGLRVLAMSFLEDGELVRRYAEELHLTLPVLTDKFGAILAAYGLTQEATTSLPRTFLIDQEQRIIAILGTEGEDFVEVIGKAFNAPATISPSTDQTTPGTVPSVPAAAPPSEAASPPALEPSSDRGGTP